MVDENITALQRLSLFKKTSGLFPNTAIERFIYTWLWQEPNEIFLSLKLLRTSISDSLSEYKLTNLALIAIENYIADEIGKLNKL